MTLPRSPWPDHARHNYRKAPMNPKHYRKAIVAALGLFVSLGILEAETAQELGSAVTAVLVYLIPND